MIARTKQQRRMARARKSRARTIAIGKPRLVINKSLNATYAQIILPDGNCACGTSSLKGSKGVKGAEEVGVKIAELAQKKNIIEVSFDRNGFKYHGKVKSLADKAREGGLKF